MTNIHFIGIGGISMSKLATYMQSRGAMVSGSNDVENTQTKWLAGLGVSAEIGHDERNVPEQCDLVVTTHAIAMDNPELVEAKRRGIKIMMREELLAHIAGSFNQVVAIAGAHGKSTTTAMISHVFNQAGIPHTCHNGANSLSAEPPMKRIGEILITEACEYKRAFLKLKPTVAVVTNIDYDHMDCYFDSRDLENAFLQFINSATVVFKSWEHAPLCVAKVCGKSQNVAIMSHITGETCTFLLNIPGEHNAKNAAVAAAVAEGFGISIYIISSALESFRGIAGRFQEAGHLNDCKIIFDYAHHPNELRALIKTARTIFTKFKIIFQPHTFSRTKELFPDFVEVLSGVDCAIFETYAARENPIAGGGSRDLASALRRRHYSCVFSIDSFIKKNAGRYDAIIIAGAGDLAGKLDVFKE